MPLHVYNTAQLRDCTPLNLVPKYHLFGAHTASPVLIEVYTVGYCAPGHPVCSTNTLHKALTGLDRKSYLSSDHHSQEYWWEKSRLGKVSDYWIIAMQWYDAPGHTSCLSGHTSYLGRLPQTGSGPYCPFSLFVCTRCSLSYVYRVQHMRGKRSSQFFCPLTCCARSNKKPPERSNAQYCLLFCPPLTLNLQVPH